MDDMKVPYLCGGVLFFLLTKAALPDGTARDHQAGLMRRFGRNTKRFLQLFRS